MRAGVALVVLAGCRLGFDPRPLATDDAGEPDAFDPCAAEKLDLGLWGTPTKVAGVSSAEADDDPILRFDGRELIFGSLRAGSLGLGDFWRITRASTGDPWGPVENITELNTASNENTPGLSSDGLEIYFSSNRPGSSNEDVWRATRLTLDAPWSPATRVAELSSATLDRGVSLWNHDLSLVMHSNRSGDDDLYVSHRSTRESPWLAPVPLGVPNTAGLETRGQMSACGLELTFQTNSHGTATEMQFFVVTRTSVDEPFGNERELVELNTPQYEEDLFITADRRHAYFSTQREGGAGELYEATR